MSDNGMKAETSAKAGAVELTEAHLDSLSGGPIDYLLEIKGIAGESTKQRHQQNPVGTLRK